LFDHGKYDSTLAVVKHHSLILLRDEFSDSASNFYFPIGNFFWFIPIAVFSGGHLSHRASAMVRMLFYSILLF